MTSRIHRRDGRGLPDRTPKPAAVRPGEAPPVDPAAVPEAGSTDDGCVPVAPKKAAAEERRPEEGRCAVRPPQKRPAAPSRRRPLRRTARPKRPAQKRRTPAPAAAGRPAARATARPLRRAARRPPRTGGRRFAGDAASGSWSWRVCSACSPSSPLEARRCAAARRIRARRGARTSGSATVRMPAQHQGLDPRSQRRRTGDLGGPQGGCVDGRQLGAGASSACHLRLRLAAAVWAAGDDAARRPIAARPQQHDLVDRIVEVDDDGGALSRSLLTMASSA